MKKTKIILWIGAILLSLTCSCTSAKKVNYADREWHISDYYGQIIDKDTTYRMTFGDVLIPVGLNIISSADSAAKYPGMDRFIYDILHTAGIENDELLFFVPYFGTIFVRLKNECRQKKPISISSNLNDKNPPYTFSIYDNDVEDWNRKPNEMYTYTYFNYRKQQILVVDFYDYGETPIAQIHVYQTRNKMTDRMSLTCRWEFFTHKVKDYKKYIDFWSNRINGHRANSFANYRIGQEQLKKKK